MDSIDILFVAVRERNTNQVVMQNFVVGCVSDRMRLVAKFSEGGMVGIPPIKATETFL